MTIRTPSEERVGRVREVSGLLRSGLWTAVALVMGLGLYLNLIISRTDTLFAWTIAPELTTAFMGAAYLSAGVLVAGAAREQAWANARVGATVAATFTTLTSLATILHLDKFHFSKDGFALASTWTWMAIYIVFPLILIVLIARQAKLDGVDPSKNQPLTRAELVGYSLLAIWASAWGAGLVVDQGSSPQLWPWLLTPLTAQVVGAWLLSAGVGIALVVREADWRSVRAVIPGFTLFGVLQLLELVRLSDSVQWNNGALIAYVLLLLLFVVAGVWGIRASRPATSTN